MHVKFTKHMTLWWMWVMILAWCTVAEFAHAYTPKMNLILKETDRICISDVTICNWWTRAIFLMAWAEWPGHCINLLQFILKSRLIVSSRCLIHELIHWCWRGVGCSHSLMQVWFTAASECLSSRQTSRLLKLSLVHFVCEIFFMEAFATKKLFQSWTLIRTLQIIYSNSMEDFLFFRKINQISKQEVYFSG